MSPLAFDKQGRPFPFHRRTKKLLVRLFRNPAARGTCCQVLDADGEPLYADAECDYLEFRKLVGNVPGLYRLDQCDDDGIEIEGAPAAYVHLDIARNASPTGDADVNPLVIIERLVATQADVMKTMAAQQAALISASAEILRAPYRPAPPPRDEHATKGHDDESNDDDAHCHACEHALDDDAEPADPWANVRPIVDFVQPHLPELGAFLVTKLQELLKQSKQTAPQSITTSPPAAAPAPSTATSSAPTAAPSQAESVASAAAGMSATTTPRPAATTTSSADAATNAFVTPDAQVSIGEVTSSSASVAIDGDDTTVMGTDDVDEVMTTYADAAPQPATSTPPSSASATVSVASSTTATSPIASATVTATQPPRNAGSMTADQKMHLYVIHSRLSDRERAITAQAIARMTDAERAQWLAAVSTMTVDDAVRTLRELITQLQVRPAPLDRK